MIFPSDDKNPPRLTKHVNAYAEPNSQGSPYPVGRELDGAISRIFASGF